MAKKNKDFISGWSDVINKTELKPVPNNTRIVNCMFDLQYYCKKRRLDGGCEECGAAEYCDKFLKVKPYLWIKDHE